MLLASSRNKLDRIDKLHVNVVSEGKPKILKGVESTKILGIQVDQTLSWNKHIAGIKSRATNSIRNLHRVNKLIPRKQQIILYNSLVTPHFSYADIIWNNCSKANSNKLQQAQNYAARSILGCSKYSSATEALSRLRLLPLETKRNIHAAVHVKKTLLGNAPEDIQRRYLQQLKTEDCRGAIRGDLNYPTHKTAQYERGPLYTSIKTWNNIPLNIRDHG